MTQSRLHHLACGTRDVEKLARFYREVLELPEIARHVESDGALRSIWLDLGGAILMLERTSAVREPVHGVGAGLFLLALRVTPEQREILERRLEASGAVIEDRTPYTSYARDPDGNRIAISHY